MHQEILDTVRTPTLPAVVARLNALLDDPEVGITEVAQAVSEDPSVSAMVLRVANSAVYGLREPARDIQRAAMVLGMRELQNIVMRVAVIQGFSHLQKHEDFDLREVWIHSILSAQVIQALARKARAALPLAPEELYSCGLLHDLGKVVLFDNYGEQYVDVVVRARTRGVPTWECEVETFGFSHPQVGGVVAFLWTLPGEIEEAIDHHHGTEAQITASPVVAATVLADQISNRVQEAGEADPTDLAAHPAAGAVGLSVEDLAELIEHAREVLPAIEV